MRILVVEDDPNISLVINTVLQQERYAVDAAPDGQIGLELSNCYEYDLILLDVSLPKLNGISICEQIRAKGNTVPILLLTALDSTADRVRGLNAGADDYLSKPFDPAELLARIRTLLRRTQPILTPVLTWGELQLDPVSTLVTYADRVVAVTPKEYGILELFLRNGKRVFSCGNILDHLWSYDEAPSEEAIRTHIKGLRQKLKLAGAGADLVETVYGIGYRLKPLTSPADSSSPTTVSLLNAWQKFKGQINDQVSILEQLSTELLKNKLRTNWQDTVRDITHSLAGTLGTFGFPLGSELARQIEKMLEGNVDLTKDQAHHFASLVTALQQEIDRPISIENISHLECVSTTNILVAAADPYFGRELKAAAATQDWCIHVTKSISNARLQLQHHSTQAVLLAPDSNENPEEVLRLLIDASKHIPKIPVVLASNSTITYPEITNLGVCVTLPPTSIPDILTALEAVIQDAARSQTHVLVVDDDIKVLAILQALLIPWGFKVTTIANPHLFWETLESSQPDLLILDARMPGISGLEICQAVRERNMTDLPIIFLTAYAEPSLIQHVFAVGADDFVTKPVIGPEIILRITNLLERKKLQQLQSAKYTKAFSAQNLSYNCQFAAQQVQEFLYLLRQDTLDLHSPEGHQLLQNAISHVDKLCRGAVLPIID